MTVCYPFRWVEGNLIYAKCGTTGVKGGGFGSDRFERRGDIRPRTKDQVLHMGLSVRLCKSTSVRDESYICKKLVCYSGSQVRPVSNTRPVLNTVTPTSHAIRPIRQLKC
eukprot:6184817-Pleurochrysis_carterae.AAC.1